ncbi:MAG: ABC transporter substrate-binding protein, partial [Rhodospirillaceae bacterium]|nr:ABC transporter substrate-binding protein [Rhodospirillaceae bacterium]
MTNTVTNGWDFRKFNPNAGTPPSSPSPAPDAPAKTQEPPAVAATPAPDSIPAPTPPLQNDTAPPVEPAKAVINVAGDVPAGEMRVAILLPLSGANATLGRAMLNAAQLSLFELADKNFVLMTYDTRGDANGAAQAAESATRDGAGLILGPLLAESVAAARARVQDIG